jgi:D-serine deaminase-like pyridoxal phosphate-dependent protein
MTKTVSKISYFAYDRRSSQGAALTVLSKSQCGSNKCGVLAISWAAVGSPHSSVILGGRMSHDGHSRHRRNGARFGVDLEKTPLRDELG